MACPASQQDSDYSCYKTSDFLCLLGDDPTTSGLNDFSGGSTHSQRAGRHMVAGTQLLNGFITVRNNRRVQKENLRVCLYRGLLRCLKRKHVAITQRLNIQFHEFDPVYYKTVLSDLYNHYDQYRDLIDQFLVSPQVLGEHSYNGQFFTRVFGEPIVKVCMQKYMDFVFFDTQAKVMEQRLCMMCCPAEEHVMECAEKWEALKKFCLEQLF